MVSYAAQDVQYLPDVYRRFKETLSRDVIDNIFNESDKCNVYAYINKKVDDITVGIPLSAFVKYFYHFIN